MRFVCVSLCSSAMCACVCMFALLINSTMSSDLVWELVKKNNRFLVKRDGAQFSGEPFNLKNQNSFKYSGLANTRAVNVALSKDGKKVELSSKNPARPARLSLSLALPNSIATRFTAPTMPLRLFASTPPALTTALISLAPPLLVTTPSADPSLLSPISRRRPEAATPRCQGRDCVNKADSLCVTSVSDFSSSSSSRVALVFLCHSVASALPVTWSSEAMCIKADVLDLCVCFLSSLCISFVAR